ncbi:MAG: hypothetical protein LRZ88_13510 [Candidatus Cloacimonetes bacterium]|nr:hypothetical protein [Candidatus Cloacimonadota bacterium]
MQALIDQASDIISFMATSEQTQSPVKERIEQILDALRLLQDPIQRELSVKEVSEAFGISQSALLSSLRRSTTSYAPKQAQEAVSLPETEIPDERYALILGLRDIESYKLLASELSADYFTSRLPKHIFNFLRDNLIEAGTIDAAALLDAAKNSDIRDGLAELLFEDSPLPDLSKLIRDLKLRKIQRDLEALDNAISADPENRDLLSRKSELLRVYRMMTKKVVNKVLY